MSIPFLYAQQSYSCHTHMHYYTHTCYNVHCYHHVCRSPFLVLGVGISLYSLPYTWPEAPDQSDALLVYTEANYFNYIAAISYHYRSVYINTLRSDKCSYTIC